MSLAAFSDSNSEKRELERWLQPLSILDVIPLNSPVKESTAKFLLKVPTGFEIDEIRYKVKNASRLFEKDKPYEKIDLINGPQGKELHVAVSKLPPGFYQLFVKVKDKKNKEYEFKNKYKDHAMFVIDSSLQMPMPNERENNKTIGGVDSDGDGIRDDIQSWIDERYSSLPNVKLALRQIAIGKQFELLSVDNKEQSIIASRKILNNSICLTVIVGIDAKGKIEDELYSKILNTKERHQANTKSNVNFSGQIFELPQREVRSSLCDFNIGNPL